MRRDLTTRHDDRTRGLLFRLARDRAGNTLAMIAAALLPILAMVGGGIDMGRSYLSQTRLQQACDAGVLAARKKLGSQVVATGDVPADVATAGNRFFNVNFQAGDYGSENRDFQMTLEEDYAISGVATVDVPTTIMGIFGYDNTALKVQCEARLNFSNTDIMFVLDTTGSMAETNSGDSMTRIEAMRSVVRSFHAQLEGSKTQGTRIRYGFVPYSTNVNVGGLLQDDWMVTNWQYQSREQVAVGTNTGTRSYDTNWATVSGTPSATQRESASDFAGTWHPPVTTTNPGSTTIDANENVVVIPPSTTTTPGYYSCDSSGPSDSLSNNDTAGPSRTEPFVGPPAGTRTITPHTRVLNGRDYWVSLSGSQCQVSFIDYNNVTQTYDIYTDPTESTVYNWRYRQLPANVSNWRNESNGCIEERDTYEINDYDNVDLDRALDLNLDLVPTADDATKWRPMYGNLVFARSMRWDGTGSFTQGVVTTAEDFVNPAWGGLAACPAAAKKLTPMDTQEVADYLGTLQPNGATYHDIGMIWGGRLMSPTGLFADENTDEAGKPTNRNLIFLTDGETAPLDISYASYGIEPLDKRRWKEGSALTLTQTVEQRFGVACAEVRKRNITVWVVGFGTTLNPIMTECAGPGHFFEANDSAELNDVFDKIAASIGDLRISK